MEYCILMLNQGIQGLRRGSPFRRGAWMTLSEDIQLKKWLKIDIGVGYQERVPLEVLKFPMGDPSQQIPGVEYIFIFSNYPTNPQNNLFETFEGEIVRLPNFKYLNSEIIPTISLGGKVKYSIGIGCFGGILLNRKTTTVSKEDLPKRGRFFWTSYRCSRGSFISQIRFWVDS